MATGDERLVGENPLPDDVPDGRRPTPAGQRFSLPAARAC